MIDFVLRRLARIVPMTLAVSAILFLLFQAVPGDPASNLAGPAATQAEIDHLRQTLGLDRPIHTQYFGFVFGVLRGDFGFSITFRGNPFPFIVDRLPATFALMAAAMSLTIAIGIPAGVIAAVRQGTVTDYGLLALVAAFLAVPNFWLGLVLITFFTVELGWLPSFGFSGALSLIMPSIALSARLIALVARMTRGVVLEELGKDYVRTARAKGLTDVSVVARHVLRNAMIPTVTVIGLQLGYLLGGSVVIERLFAWPGIGDLMINGVGMRDHNLVLSIALLFVVGFLLINLLVDLLYAVINPRVELQ